MPHLERVLDHVRTSLWVYPAAAAVLAVVAGAGTVWIDHGTDAGFAGGAEAARTILSTVAGAMITFTGLVFSITIVALQLASAQFSPRVMRTFLRDRTSKVALATFVATFIYAFTVLRATRADDVPGISVTVSILLVFVSVGVFIHYINHTAHAIRASAIIGSVAAESRACLERTYPRERDEPPATGARRSNEPRLVGNEDPGVVTGFNAERLVEVAAASDAVLVLRAGVGEFVPHGAPLLEVHGELPEDENVAAFITFDQERTMQQDLAFGFRQLVDLAIKALSPSINDPTTAVQALDHVHDLLRRLAGRPMPSGHRADDDGVVRLVHPAMDWEHLVGLGVDEVRHYGTDSPQVVERLRRMLEDLIEVAPEDRRAPLRDRLALLGA